MKIRKIGIFIVCIFLGTTCLAGCSIGDTKVVFQADLAQKEVFEINKKPCSLSEAKVFLTNYQNIYATMYGVDLWKHDFGNGGLYKYVKELTISQLAQIKSMISLAEQEDIMLTEDELEKIKVAAKEYYDSLTEKEIQYMEISQGTIEELYRQYGLANKLYTHLTTGVNDEVSDDEARIIQATQIYIKSEMMAKEIKNKLDQGGDFASLASTYNEAVDNDITFGRGVLPKEVEEAAFAMETNDIIGYIETEGGYYFLKCINNYNQELTDENKLVIVEKRRKEKFDDVYDEFVLSLPSKFNKVLWDAVEIEINSQITTSSFFEVYDKYCKW
ncbi:peptidyl-prolyl cis-trans isomerase [Lachnospiraceae bacterium ZAX-1]